MSHTKGDDMMNKFTPYAHDSIKVYQTVEKQLLIDFVEQVFISKVQQINYSETSKLNQIDAIKKGFFVFRSRIEGKTYLEISRSIFVSIAKAQEITRKTERKILKYRYTRTRKERVNERAQYLLEVLK